MIAGELGLTIDQALAFEKRHGDRYQVIYKPGLIYEHIDLNLDNPILADLRVRKALIMGLDREALSEQLFAGRQAVADTSVNPLATTKYKDIQGNGSALRVIATDASFDAIVPPGSTVEVTVVNPTAGSESAPIEFTRP